MTLYCNSLLVMYMFLYINMIGKQRSLIFVSCCHVSASDFIERILERHVPLGELSDSHTHFPAISIAPLIVHPIRELLFFLFIRLHVRGFHFG